VPEGAVVVHVADDSRVAVVAAVSACDRLATSDGGTLRIPCAPGPIAVSVRADGYDPAQVEVVVPATGEVSVEVVLHRPAVALVGQQLIVGDRIRFDTDDAEVQGSDGALEALAAWLRAHPEVTLLRIEGHADDAGTPAYNLDLSERRAVSVVAALVARGVAAERLRPIGSGESRRAGDEAAERMVEFLVLVWDETSSADAPPP
jgi:outer membrane protein OmpA-like peptidoglycan-associated protein